MPLPTSKSAGIKPKVKVVSHPDEDDEDAAVEEVVAPKPKPKLKLTKAVPKGHIKVVKQVDDTEEIVQDEDVEVEGADEVVQSSEDEEPWANVGMRFGVKLPIAHIEYSNFSYDVSLYLPSKPSDIDSTFEFVKDWVEARVNDLVAANQPEE